MSGRKAYEGDGITVYFEGKRCIHAGECVRGLPTVFDANHRPWINPPAGSADDIAAVVARCPSGALSFERSDGGAPEAPDPTPVVTAVKDGPLHLRGIVEIVGEDGQSLNAGPRAALCRCGHSKNKPFCDNSHIDAGFTTG